VARKEIARAAQERALPEIRALLLVQLGERGPPPGLGGVIGFRTDGLRHVRVRLTDAAGRTLERSVTGTRSDDTQLEILPMLRLLERLDTAIGRLGSAEWWDAGPDNDVADTRSFFVGRFLATMPTAKWWVKQFTIQIAAEIGTPAVIPDLINVARDDDPQESRRLHRMHALAALARLTGFDARRDANGREVAEADTAAAYARACLGP